MSGTAVLKAALLLFASGDPDTLLSYADRIAIDDAGRSGHGTRPLFSNGKTDIHQQGRRGSDKIANDQFIPSIP